VNGDVATERISVEDGAVLKGGIQVRSGQQKQQAQSQAKPVEAPTMPAELPKPLAATASA